MANKGRASVTKRNREQTRKERNQDKAEQRVERAAQRQSRADAKPGEDPDIAHIVHGPQPVES